MTDRYLEYSLAKIAVASAFFALFSASLQGQAQRRIFKYRWLQPGWLSGWLGYGEPHSFSSGTGFRWDVSRITGSDQFIGCRTPTGNPSLPANAFTTTALIILKGAWDEITANFDTNITIDIGSDDISALSGCDAFDIISYWTCKHRRR